MSLDVAELAAALRAAVSLPAVLEQLRAEIRELRAELAAVSRRLPPRLVSVGQAAELLGVSVATVRRHVASGVLPSLRVGASVRVDLSRVAATDARDVAELAGDARRRDRAPPGPARAVVRAVAR